MESHPIWMRKETGGRVKEASQVFGLGDGEEQRSHTQHLGLGRMGLGKRSVSHMLPVGNSGVLQRLLGM